MGFIERDNKIFAIITADGALRIPSNENDPQAVKRVIEKTDGTEVTKYELVKRGYTGLIENITFSEMAFGKMINVAFKLEEGEQDRVVLSMNTDNNFCTDFMKKLPNVDLAKEVSISPFSFIGDTGKPVKGITVWQGEVGNMVKTPNFFREGEGKGAKNVNGLPEPKGDTKKFDKDDWKMYFTTVKKFLVKYTEDKVVPKLGAIAVEECAKKDDGIKVDDIPFE